MRKNMLFYVHPDGAHTNERLVELLEGDTDCNVSQMKLCGAGGDIGVISLNEEKMKLVWASRTEARLRFQVLRRTVHGLVHLADEQVEEALGLQPMPAGRHDLRAVAAGAERQLATVLAGRANRETGAFAKNCLPQRRRR